MKSLKGTETAKNLLKSFAAESQARNRYIFYSEVAKNEGYEQISDIFKLTAENEQGHAEIFFNYLVNDFNNEYISIEANYPIAKGSTLSNLQSSAKAENHEHSEVYPAFADIARNEGFSEIANSFTLISKIEKHHKERFETLATNVQNNKVFQKDEKSTWICRYCGYIIEDFSAPEKCPVCSHPQAYYEILNDSF